MSEPDYLEVQVWQVVLDMPSKEMALNIAECCQGLGGGRAWVQALTRYIPQDVPVLAKAKFDRVAYQREYMRKRRARQRETSS
jgi:hypothetical protein